jgi:hypothetical protein
LVFLSAEDLGDPEQEDVMGGLWRGAAAGLAGLAGTAAMSAAMAIARLVGLMGGEAPPRQVARNLEEGLGVRDNLSRPAFEASWVIQHVAYGMAAGVAYEPLRGRIPLGEPIPAGLAFGTALWAAGYAGWAPALGLTPPPTREPARRIATEIVTHLIYGTTTAEVARRLRAS